MAVSLPTKCLSNPTSGSVLIGDYRLCPTHFPGKGNSNRRIFRSLHVEHKKVLGLARKQDGRSRKFSYQEEVKNKQVGSSELILPYLFRVKLLYNCVNTKVGINNIQYISCVDCSY